MKGIFLTSVILFSLFFFLVGSARARAETTSSQCEAAAREIAAAYGSDEFEKWLGKDFRNRDAVLSALKRARSEGDKLRLELLSVKRVEIQAKPAAKSRSECLARVRTQVMASRKDGSERPIGGAETSTWRVLLPATRVREDTEPPPEQWLLGSHWGRAVLRVHWVLPEGMRDKLLALPKAKEVGLQPSPHPQAVLFPDRSANGFYVRLGDQQTMVSEDGRFALTITDKSPKEGEIINPGNGSVVATFNTSSLVPAKGDPTPIIVELGMFGECGMDHGGPATDPACHGLMEGGQP